MSNQYRHIAYRELQPSSDQKVRNVRKTDMKFERYIYIYINQDQERHQSKSNNHGFQLTYSSMRIHEVVHDNKEILKLFRFESSYFRLTRSTSTSIFDILTIWYAYVIHGYNERLISQLSFWQCKWLCIVMDEYCAQSACEHEDIQDPFVFCSLVIPKRFNDETCRTKRE